MSIETRMQAAPTIAIGLCIIAVGVALTLDRLQVMEAYTILRFWPVAIILIGGSIILQALWPPTDPQALQVRQSGLPKFLLLLLIIGFLVGPRVGRAGRGVRSDDRDMLSSVAVLSGDRHVSLSQQLRGGDVTVFMGGADLDLRRAAVAPSDTPVIDIFAMMGGVTLRIPQGWTVDVQAVPIMGAVRDRRLTPGSGSDWTDALDGSTRPERDADRSAPPSSTGPSSATPATPGTPAAAGPRIVIRGTIIMGGLDIRS